MFKKFLRFFAGIVFCLLIIMVTLPYLFRDRIKAEIFKEVEENVDAHVQIGDLHLGLFRHIPHLTLSLHDLHITGKGDFEGDTLAFIKVLDLEVDLWKLIRQKQLCFRSIRMTEPKLHFRILENGAPNYDIFGKESSDTSAGDTTRVALDIEKITIHQGSLIYEDAAEKLFAWMEDVEHDGKGNFSHEIFDWKTKTKIKQISIEYNNIQYLNKKETDLNLLLEVNTKDNRILFKENNIKINHFSFGVDGFFQLLPAGYAMDLRFAARETLFKNLLSLLPGIYAKDLARMKTSGDLAFDGFVKGIYNDSTNQFPNFHVNLKVKDAYFRFDSLPLPMENIQFHLVADNKDGNIGHTIWDLKTFRATMDKNVAEGSIRVEGMQDPHINAKIHASIDLEDLERFYPVERLHLKGKLGMDIKAEGVYSTLMKKFPIIDARFDLSNGSLRSDDFPETVEDIHLTGEAMNTTGAMKDTRLNIGKLMYTLGGEPFWVTGNISDLEDYNYDLKIKGLVDLGRLTKIFPVEGIHCSGIIDSDIETRGSMKDLEAKRYENIRSDGRIEFKNITVSGNRIPARIAIQDALFRLSPSTIWLDRFAGKFGNSDVNMSGKLTDYMALFTASDDRISGDLDLRCDTLDLNEWFGKPAGSARVASSPDTSGSMQVIPVPRNVDFVFDSEIGYCRYDDLKMTDMDGEIRIKDGVLRLKETGFNSLNARFFVSGDYNTTDIHHPLMDLHVSIKELDINKAYREVALIRTLAPAAQNTFGIFSIDYSLKAELSHDMTPLTQTMEGAGEIRIHEARINGMKLFEEIKKVSRKEEMNNPSLKDFVLDTEIRNNKIFVKPCSLKISGLNTEIEGSSTFNGAMDYLMKIELLPIEKLKIPFHITGTYDKPKVNMGKGQRPKDAS